MNHIVVANIIALIASLLMIYTGFVYKKNKIIYLQAIQKVFLIISDLILGGITGALTNFIGLIRNILCYKDKLKLKQKIILIIISVILALLINNIGFIGMLPIISIYTWFIDEKNIVKFKKITIYTTMLWFIYDTYIQSYSSAAFYLMTILSNIYAIYRLHLSKKKIKLKYQTKKIVLKPTT